MRTSTNNPMAVVIKSEIDIHTAITAIQEFAEKYPVERLSVDQAHALHNAAVSIWNRLIAARTKEV